MSRNFGFALAVPQAALARGGEQARLMIDSTSWGHLTAYLEAVAQLPAQFGDGEPALRAPLVALRAAVQRFGNPRQARALLHQAPASEPAGQSAGQPAALTLPLYAGLIGWVRRLHEAAASVAQILQGQAHRPNDDAGYQPRLAAMSAIAATLRTHILPLMEALGALRSSLTDAHAELARGAAASAGQLQHAQEAVGAAEFECASLEARIAGLGLFDGYKRPDMLQRLARLKAALAQRRAQAEQLRQQLAVTEALLGHGGWLNIALDETASFLEQSRSAWTAFGAGVAQLAADATPAELADTALIDQRLDRAEAIVQWSALSEAARRFAAAALSEAPAPARADRNTP